MDLRLPHFWRVRVFVSVEGGRLGNAREFESWRLFFRNKLRPGDSWPLFFPVRVLLFCYFKFGIFINFLRQGICAEYAKFHLKV